MPKPMILEVFSDYVCPWCYLGNSRTKKIQQDYHVLIKLIHFPLHPKTPIEGILLHELFGCGVEEIKAKNLQMQLLMQEEGLPYTNRSHTYNSRLAQEIGVWADVQMGAHEIHDKFYEAYFVDGRNIGDIEVIVQVIKSIGLDEEEARAVITERQYKDAVDADWEKSVYSGVTGVPTYLSDSKRLVGAQPYEVLQKLMSEVGVKKR